MKKMSVLFETKTGAKKIIDFGPNDIYDEKNPAGKQLNFFSGLCKKFGFENTITEEKYIELSKEIKKLVSNKSKYTDWTNRQDVKDELYFDVAVLLRKNGYPPTKPIDEAYDEIMKQVENFKKYN